MILAPSLIIAHQIKMHDKLFIRLSPHWTKTPTAQA